MIFRIGALAAAITLGALATGLEAALAPPVHADARAMILPVHAEKLVAHTSAGEKSFTVEIADEPGEQQRGLMFRQEMEDDHGMLFELGTSRQTSFWMENTPMPLDLVFIGEDGKVVATLPGEPFSRRGISPGVPVRFVLELKRGVASANGIAAGDRVNHPVIDAVAGSN